MVSFSVLATCKKPDENIEASLFRSEFRHHGLQKHTGPGHNSALMQVGVGSHRVAVAQIVERLSFARLAAVNTHLVRAGLLPRLFALGFSCPYNSVLQAACCGIIR